MPTNLTLLQMVEHVRALVKDDGDVLNQNNEIEEMINEAAHWYRSIMRPTPIRLSSTNCGLSLLTGAFLDLSSQTNWDRILSIHLESSVSSVDGPALTPVGLGEWCHLRKNVLLASGTPTHYTAFRLADSDLADSGKWRVLFLPVADATYYFSAVVDRQWTNITSDATIFTRVTREDAYTIARVAAIQCASLLARDAEFIDALSRMLPDRVRSAMGLNERNKIPRLVGT